MHRKISQVCAEFHAAEQRPIVLLQALTIHLITTKLYILLTDTHVQRGERAAPT
jgi:hypothetical protein